MKEYVRFGIFPVAIVTVLFFIILYKAAYVPATFDEVTTYQIYTGMDKVDDIILNTGGNTNNHILNSLFITVSQLIFGVQLWTLRLPNVLSFIILCLGVAVMARRYFADSPLLFCFPFICLLLNTYALDFYSLARGYGMANAFVICSVVALLEYNATRKLKWYYPSLFFAALAAYANFVLLIFCMAVPVLLVINLFLNNKAKNALPVLIRTIVALMAVGLICYYPLTSIQQCLQSNFAGHRDFYQGVLIGNSDRYFYGKIPFNIALTHWVWVVLGVVVWAALICICKFKKNGWSAFSNPLSHVFILLVTVLAINIVQVYITGTNYPGYRTALIYDTLFFLVFIFLVRELWSYNLRFARPATALLICMFVLQFVRTVNLKSFYDLSYDAYTDDVISYMEHYRIKHPERKFIELNLTNCFRNSFAFSLEVKHLPWLILPSPANDALANKMADTSSQALFYYTVDRNALGLKNYHPVKTFVVTGVTAPLQDAGSEQYLLIHN